MGCTQPLKNEEIRKGKLLWYMEVDENFPGEIKQKKKDK